MSLSRPIALAQGGQPSDAEQALLAFLLRELQDRYPIRSSVEIHDSSGTTYEIDLVILGHHGLYVVEVKAWRGRISFNEEGWAVTPPGGAAQLVSDPLGMAARKGRLLSSLLEQEMGESRPWVEVVVVVTGPNADIALPPELRAHVLTPHELVRAVQFGDLPGRPLPDDRLPVGAAAAIDVARILEQIRIRPRPGHGRLRDQAQLVVRWLAADLRARDPEVRERHRLDELHGALWWMACAFVRALEERGLVEARIAGKAALDAQSDFFQMHPTESASRYLRQIVGDVAACPAGGAVLGDLLGEMDETPLSADGARALLEFFRQMSSSGRPRWSFAGDPWTDLYQSVSPDLQREHGMIGTPVFVGEMLLDQTLTPALEEDGLEGTRILDPACGSGVLLLLAFERILARLQATEPEQSREAITLRALEKVHGADISPLAVLVTRARLALSFLERAGVERLARAPRLPLDVAVADSLLAGTEGRSSDDAEADAFGRRYTVVVSEPPYVSCADSARRDRYRSLYRSASGKFSLAAPFIERCFQLVDDGGFVGVLASSSFMRRQFGRRLVEEVLAAVDLTHVVDLDGVFVPNHSTPSLVLVGRKRSPLSGTVRVVACKRGEPMVPSDPARGEVWSTITQHLDTPGYEDDYIWVADLPRAALAKHPWSLTGGVRSKVMERVEQVGSRRLRGVAAAIRAGVSSGRDEVFVLPRGVARRLGLEPEVLRPCVSGDSIGDWTLRSNLCALGPYGTDGVAPLPPDPASRWWRYLWRYRAVLETRTLHGSPVPGSWWTWSSWSSRPLPGVPRLLCRAVGSMSQFVLDRGDGVTRPSVLGVEMPARTSEDDCLALLAYLNSSVVCFWLKQTSFEKHAFDDRSVAGMGVFDLGARVGEIPVPEKVFEAGPFRASLLAAARRLGHAAEERAVSGPEGVLARWDRTSRDDLLEALGQAQMREIASLRTMVSCQEQIDWLIYEGLGLTSGVAGGSVGAALPEDRPFGWLSDEPPAGLDRRLVEVWRRRRAVLRGNPMVEILEAPAFKRSFRSTKVSLDVEVDDEEEDAEEVAGASRPRVARGREFRERLVIACEAWLLERIEELFRDASPVRPMGVDEITSCLAASAGGTAVTSLLRDLQEAAPLAVMVRSLVETNAASFAAALRYTASGRRTRAIWEETWQLQRRKDGGEQVACPVPPAYRRADYRDSVTWHHRGRLDVPTERFIRYPGASPDGTAALYGWAGWDEGDRLQALRALVVERFSRDGWDETRLMPFLSGMSELAVDLPSAVESGSLLAAVSALRESLRRESQSSVPSPERKEQKGSPA